MQRVSFEHRHPLYDSAATRAIEQAGAAALAPHTLMQRAGLAVARLALALAPHARTVWIACGPGNNGGDGLEAAMHLRRWGLNPVVTWLGHEAQAPADALASLQRARQAGVPFLDEPPRDLTAQDLCIDALLGIGVTRPPQGRMAQWIAELNLSPAPTLAVDLPSGLQADTGALATSGDGAYTEKTADQVHAQHTLSLLTLKPGLFTAHGRDVAGQVWFDDLQVQPHQPPSAWLAGAPQPTSRPHASHKGSYGDVAVIGGEGLAARGMGMTGAALLAASAALHGGAGRVLLHLLDADAPTLDLAQPELMFRSFAALQLPTLSIVCGCGGGEAIRPLLPEVLAHSARLVLDADALNAIAADPLLPPLLQARADRGQPTVLTPHPLEAARLLGCSAGQVQADRLGAAHALAQRCRAVVILKGSGTVVASADAPPVLNPTGNALLATAGTGDVLAGLVGARLASGLPALAAACEAVYLHGAAADRWPLGQVLTAGVLARSLAP